MAAWGRTQRPTPEGALAAFTAVACALIVFEACASETHERPAHARAQSPTPIDEPVLLRAPPPPLPSGAFSRPADPASATAPSPLLRHETVRIGEVTHDEPLAGVGRNGTIDLDVKDADLHNVFRLLADVGQTNVVVADDVRGTVTLRLRDVDWRRALRVVAEAKGLTLRHEGNIIFVQGRTR